MKAFILPIGDEILIGQTVDTNSAWLGQKLNETGIAVEGIRVVRDAHDHILSALNSIPNDVNLVLITGGLGPTKDDITKAALAQFFETPLVFQEEMYNRILAFFERLGRPANDAHREQCHLPQSADLLHNAKGTAPGMWFEKDGIIYIAMPGVPYEMKSIFEHEVMPRLKTKVDLPGIYHRTLLTAGAGESQLALLIQDIESNLPESLSLAYLPSIGTVKIRITGRHTSTKSTVDRITSEIKASVEVHYYGENKTSLSEALKDVFVEKNLKLAIAESCTGGAISKAIVSVPGASAFYEGSTVVYSYALKESLLNVQNSTLEAHGAVSEQTVLEMLNGVLNLSDADIGLAVSGIAGPGGAQPNKPVGTIWLAFGSKNNQRTLKLQLGKNRALNIAYTVNRGLFELFKFIKQG